MIPISLVLVVLVLAIYTGIFAAIALSGPIIRKAPWELDTAQEQGKQATPPPGST